jgi:hypothetical protein
MRAPIAFSSPTSLLLLMVGCQMPNPAFDARGEDSETRGQDTLAGDGDGDTSAGDGDGDDDPTGDGDGDPSTGDGDGDPTSDDGDGDGDPTSGDGDGDPTSGDGDGDGDGDPTGDGDGDPVECLPGQMFCGDMCIDTDFDDMNCGGCGSTCADGQLCTFGMCKLHKLVFVTEGKHNGNFGGLQGANNLCIDAAAQAQQFGDFRAWMSDAQKSPATTFDVDAVFTLRTGQVVAYSLADLLDGNILTPINQTQFGVAAGQSPACNEIQYAVWTGTDAFGVQSEPNCTGWTNGGNITTGRVGNAFSVDANWSNSGCMAMCNLFLPIYCVQQ